MGAISKSVNKMEITRYQTIHDPGGSTRARGLALQANGDTDLATKTDT